jgi:hypothetical protein
MGLLVRCGDEAEAVADIASHLVTAVGTGFLGPLERIGRKTRNENAVKSLKTNNPAKSLIQRMQ